MTPQDTSEILLIDDVGCPTDYSIMAELRKAADGGSTHSVRANFDAFKFPTSNVVQFRALVSDLIYPNSITNHANFNNFRTGDTLHTAL